MLCENLLVRIALMLYRLDMALLLILERCVQERNGQAESLITENAPSTAYRSHWTTRSMAANKALATAPNEPPSLYRAARRSLTRWVCRRKDVAYPNNSPRRWAKQPPCSHDDSAPQLSSNKLTAPSILIRWSGHWDAMWVLAIMPCLFVLWLRSELCTFH